MKAQLQKVALKTPPRTWVDKDTGHRIFRVTSEPGSSILYFNFDAYTPDNRQMAYNSPAGIHMLDLSSWQSRLLVPSSPSEGITTQTKSPFSQRVLAVGRKTGSVYFSRTSMDGISSVYSADSRTGIVRKLVSLPPHASVITINSDETLASGTFVKQNPVAEEPKSDCVTVSPNESDVLKEEIGRSMSQTSGPIVKPEGKGQMMARRLAAHTPMVLFVVDLRTGKLVELLHSTDWINHTLFSPVDPTLLMYCHEGPWQLVDRIWLIRTDGTGNTLVHKRSMFMEITGHEFWSRDGQVIWYDWQFPKGDVYFLAGYKISTGERTAYSMKSNQWSIHFNCSGNPNLFAGDGGDVGQVAQAPDGTWIQLYHAEMPGRRDGVNSYDLIQPGVLRSQRLVNMAYHNYKSEPDVRISPDDRYVFFTSNMFGPKYVFAVETAPAVNPLSVDVLSTPNLAKSYGPKPPPTPYSEQW